MKKCPTCEKTFDDAMRFCQVDGTPLIDDVPFDPYATIVGTSASVTSPSDEPVAVDPTPSQSAISLPEEVLEVPNADPLKTMYVSDSEMKQVLGATGDAPAEEIRADEIEVEATVVEEPSMPEPPPPSFSDMAPPPSPFSEPSPSNEEPVPAPPMFLEPEPATQEADTVISPEIAAAVAPPPAPMQEWTPPDLNLQNQEIGSNMPFQTPAVSGENKTLAIISLVLGILSIFCCGFLSGVPAVIVGIIARGKAASAPNEYGGAGLALGGIITGVIGTVLGIILLILQILLGGLDAILRGF